MMTDQELIDGLRAELRAIQVPTDLLERLRAKAAEEDLGHARRSSRQPRRSAWTWVAAATSLAVVGAVVAIILGLAHHEQVPQHHVVGGVSPRTKLVTSLAVLRRPQTRADLQPRMFIYHAYWTLTPQRMQHARLIPFSTLPSQMRRWGEPELVRPLARVISKPELHAKVMIAPATFRPSPDSTARTLGLDLVLDANNRRAGTGPKPTTINSFLKHGLAIWDTSGLGSETLAVLVPDGVARLKISDLHPEETPARYRNRIALQARRISLTATVRNNVAVFSLYGAAVVDRGRVPTLFVIPAIAKATWLDANGAVVRHTTVKVGLSVHVRGEPSGGKNATSSAFCQLNPSVCAPGS